MGAAWPTPAWPTPDTPFQEYVDRNDLQGGQFYRCLGSAKPSAIMWKDSAFPDDIYHREGDLPAWIHENGSKSWHINGELHRTGDKPADVHSDGQKDWYLNGQLHRKDDKPAIVKPDGTQQWYKDGHQHRDGDLPTVI